MRPIRYGGPSADGRARSSFGPWGRRLAITISLAMVPGLLTPVAFAADVNPLGKPDLDAPRVTKVSPLTPKANKSATAAIAKGQAADKAAAERALHDQTTRKVTWPEAGTSTLTLTGMNAAKDTAAPGSLPVTLTGPKSVKNKKKPKVAASVTVKVLDQQATKKLGIKGVALAVTGPIGGGTAQLGINYSAFATAYGGDWAGRLTLTELDDCALIDPAEAKCRKREPLAATNDRKAELLTAPVTFTAAGSAVPQTRVLVLAAGTQSGGGDYKATPLSASSTWEAGGSSGTFTWSYPLRMPRSAAGPGPELSISYDSGAVDGRTASTNNQGTAIGEGFDITSSYVERKYGSCDDDGQADKNDLCWKYDNASLVLNGKASELVKDDTTGEWRLKSDDGSKVERGTGADNGDDNGEYWTVTTSNGTKYVFGKDKLDGAAAGDRTESTWTVPVFGDDGGEPGYTDGTTFAGRDKKQAWRWNLDFVVDAHDNAMTYWYEAEENNYDTLGDDTTGTGYIRGGYLKEIRYGQRAGALFSATPAASNKVTFGYAERCVATGTGCAALTEDKRDNWPDVPFDAVCKDSVKCTGNTGPSFFTRKRMTGITTYAWDAAASTPAYSAVDAWVLQQLYLDPGDTGDATDQSLWLDEIKHTGKRGTDLGLPPVKFTHAFLPNRVDGPTDDILSLEKPRVRQIVSEAGAQTIVSYMAADCVYGQAMPKVDENTKRCYPVYWSPNGEQEPILDWFQKYPVSAVSTKDTYGGSEAVQHSYTYSGGGAWHYNEDPFTKEKERTWSIWRGYERVTHTTGSSQKPNPLKTLTIYMRGMDGDRVLGTDGKTPDPDKRKTVSVTGIAAGAATDSEKFAGFTRETVTYNGTTEVGGVVNSAWTKKTATQHKSYADTEAYMLRLAAKYERHNATSSGTSIRRTRATANTYDDYGMIVTAEDKGDYSAVGDEKCTRTWYARNTDKGITSPVSRTRTVAKGCDIADTSLNLPADSTSPGDVINDTATAYDGAAWSAIQKPTKGDVTWAGRATGYRTDDSPIWQKTATTTYDSLGRPLLVKNADDELVTDTTYIPTASGPMTATAVANFKGHKTTSEVDFATGDATKVTDPNGKITETEHDSLGRLTKVWLPNRLKALSATPNQVYTYNLTSTGLPWVSSATLKGDGSGYNTSYQFYDSLLRSRQVQSPSMTGGRLVSQTLYDNRGLTVTTQSDIWDNTSVPSSTPVQVDGGQAPMQTDTTFDGAGRATKAVTKVNGVARWTTDTAYYGDMVTTTAPTGGQATAVLTNSVGQTTERRQYGSPNPVGTDYTTTKFSYTPSGKQKTVEGPDGAKWSYTYDLFGRTDKVADPDKGTADTDYNHLDQVTSSTDSTGQKLLFGYDELGRKTGMWEASQTDAKKLAAWTFDTLAKGQQDTAVRYEGGINQTGSKAYTQKVTAYSSLYQVTGSSLTLPSNDSLVGAGVPSTLSTTTAYNLDGTVRQSSAPALAGLPSETLSNTYNALGGQLTSKSTTSYLQASAFSPQGDLRQLTLGTDPTASAKKAYLHYEYEAGTRRLTRSYVTDDVHGYMPQELKFSQDDAGNVTSIFDATTQGGTTKADNQCFTYDGHRRLTEAWTPKTEDCSTTGRTASNIDGAAPYWSSYTYNTAGQRDTETVRTTTGSTTTTDYKYDKTPAGQIHPLTSTVTGSTTKTFGYDKAGNTTSRPDGQSLLWNSEGKLAELTQGTAKTGYLYDASGELLIRRTPSGDGDTVLYLGNTEVRLTAKGTTKTLSGTRYYAGNGKTIGVRTATAGVTGSKLNFLAADHHGTSSLALDATTYAITKRYSTPFGAERGAKVAWVDDKGFLGKSADKATGLTHIGAREYDPATGQFISVDPLLEVDKHQTINGYSYAGQSPITYSDPTGTCQDDGSGHCRPGNSSGRPDPPYTPPPSSGTASGNSDGGIGGGGGGGGGGSGGDGGGDDCGFWSSCGWSQAYDSTVNFLDENKSTIAAITTEIVVGGACLGAATAAGVATAGVGFAAAAGCGAIAGAAGSAVGNALDEDADHSVSGQLAAQAEGAVWGAAGGAFVFGAGKVINKLVGKCHSFLPGTGVLLADGTNKAIEDVEVGDVVVTTDTKTGKSLKKKVVSTITTEDDKAFTDITITVDGDYSSIVATDTHPFWIPELRKWVKAGDLLPGQRLRTSAGTHVQITAVTHYTKRQRTHDLTIQDVHAYYVLAGATPVLVHNCNPLNGVADGLAGSKVTTGQVVDDAGNRVGPPVSSGENGSFVHVRDALRKSGVPHDTAGRFAAASHVETKIAFAMRSNSVQRATVVINNSGGVCSGPYSCMTGVSAILPRGSSLTSVWRTEEGWRGVTMLGGG